ncbi:MAG: inositol monophosphatase [Chloroflexi bacterium]|nr:MAG: inositol monophosphatase [Chloroflexota bacterium]
MQPIPVPPQNEIDFSSALKAAEETALEAGELLIERFFKPRTTRQKGPRDLVTDADGSAEELIRSRLLRQFPQCQFMGEESWQGGQVLPDGLVWVIDPLDGTTNYSQRYPVFSVSIGLMYNSEIALGVVYDPMQKHLFSTRRGAGAYCAGEKLHVGSAPNLADAVVGLDWGREKSVRERMVEVFPRLLMQSETLRSGGSTALGLCYVAAGWLDAYFHFSPSLWDIAAGTLIAEEAGSVVSDLQGNQWQPESINVLAANAAVHAELLEFVREASKQ